MVPVIPDFGMSVAGRYFPEDFKDKALAKTNEDLGAFVGEHVPSGVEARHGIGYGRVYEEILVISGESKCDLIVMASQRLELKVYFLGPNQRRGRRQPCRLFGAGGAGH